MIIVLIISVKLIYLDVSVMRNYYVKKKIIKILVYSIFKMGQSWDKIVEQMNIAFL